jgi:hypothetical protein
MPQSIAALLALAALISLAQWVWARAASHVDLQLMPTHSRRHVQWMLSNSTHIQLLSAALALAALSAEVAVLLN